MVRGPFPFGLALLVLIGLLLSYLAFASTKKSYSVGDKERGEASWYGEGTTTASGEPFDRTKLTAAHRHLPFGTLVRVTNCANGRSVEVRINDRGPWKSGRIIDVSEAAADLLQMKASGEVPVEIEVIRLGSDKITHEK